MVKGRLVPTELHPKTLIVGVQAPYNPTKDIQAYYDEFRHLLRSNDIVYDHEWFTKIRSIDPAHFLTKGKLEDLIKLCQDNEIEEVVFSEPLSNQQTRNLRKVLGARVFDRTQLILEIFEKGAHSAEGKKQVDLALCQYKKARLAGKGIHFGQQAGHIGTRGPGETQKEKELQHLDRMINSLKKELKQLEKTRAIQRKRRLDSHLPLISLIGYTNAGKSTILNKLTKSDILAEDKLFATLDTTTRELFLSKDKRYLVSDTVGFIQLLPHSLIEAFKSTLDELQYARLLLHVIDASDHNWPMHTRIVHEILQELNVAEKPILYVFNKVDKLSDEERTELEKQAKKYNPHIFIAAAQPHGIEPLVNYLTDWHEE